MLSIHSLTLPFFFAYQDITMPSTPRNNGNQKLPKPSLFASKKSKVLSPEGSPRPESEASHGMMKLHTTVHPTEPLITSCGRESHDRTDRSPNKLLHVDSWVSVSMANCQ